MTGMGIQWDRVATYLGIIIGLGTKVSVILSAEIDYHNALVPHVVQGERALYIARTYPV